MPVTVIPCLFCENRIDLDSEIEPLHYIVTDWYEDKTPFSVQFSLLTDSQSLLFAGWVSLPNDYSLKYNLSFKPGEFREELWKEDVLELFLGQSNSNFYQEFNIAPSGAWWSAAFRNYREPLLEADIPKAVQTFSELGEGSWHARILIPLESLLIPNFQLEKSTCNMNAILGDHPRYFFSYAKLSSSKPDFHLVDEFLPTQE